VWSKDIMDLDVEGGKMDFVKYLNKKIECGCGNTHFCGIEDIIIEDGALLKIPRLIRNKGYKQIFVVSDLNTEVAAGLKVKELLTENQIAFQAYVFSEKELIPDEKAVGTLLIQVPVGCDLILAVGSGTLNDLSRFVTSKLGIDYYVIATAPSMDGFASNVSPLIVDHVKTTYEIKNEKSSGMPKAIIGDLTILSEAPMEMIAAGAGDILGKYVCIADWQISHIITGEYYCSDVAIMIQESIEKIVAAIPKLRDRDKNAISDVMEGLVLSGIAMSFIGNSRPASGSEHHVSHYWEMMSLLRGSHGALHGIKVGVGTVLCLKLYKKLGMWIEKGETARICKQETYIFNKEEWNQKITEAYQIAAPSVILLEDKVHKNGEEAVNIRRKNFLIHENEILTIIDNLPAPEDIEAYLFNIQAPVNPGQIQVSSQEEARSILYAKDLRNRFGLLQILHDLNLNQKDL